MSHGLRFKLFLEADEDYRWFVMGQGPVKIKDFHFSPTNANPARLFGLARTFAERELTRLDPQLNVTLKPEFKNMLLNWMTHIYIQKHGWEPFSQSPHNPQPPRQPGFLPQQDWNKISPVFHANMTNPKFWQSLQRVSDKGGGVTPGHLAKDAETLRASQKGGEVSRVGPRGFPVMNFSDGHQWVRLDTPYCPQEGRAGRHCGNVMGQHRTSDVILSLRDPAGQVEATFVVNGGTLMESKGPGNTKLNPRFYQYVVPLFLASGPSPLPIERMNYRLEHLYQPHLDTTVVDLLVANEVDEESKEQLTQKFHDDLNNPTVREALMKREMDDEHRRKLLRLWHPEWDDAEHEDEFRISRRRASDQALLDGGFFTGEGLVKQYQKNEEELLQIINYNTKEVNRLLEPGAGWKRYIKVQAKQWHEDTARENLSYRVGDLELVIKEFEPDTFLPVRLVKEIHGNHGVDSPARRNIRKALIKFMRTSWQFAKEVAAAHQPDAEGLSSRGQGMLYSEAEKVGNLVEGYFQKWGIQ